MIDDIKKSLVPICSQKGHDCLNAGDTDGSFGVPLGNVGSQSWTMALEKDIIMGKPYGIYQIDGIPFLDTPKCWLIDVG